MNEKMDLIIIQGKKTQEAIESLSSWRTYLLGGVAAVGLIYGLAVAHGPALLRLVGAGL